MHARAQIARVESKLERYFEGFEDGRLAAELFQELRRAYALTSLTARRRNRHCACARLVAARLTVPRAVQQHEEDARSPLVGTSEIRALLPASIALGLALGLVEAAVPAPPCNF